MAEKQWCFFMNVCSQTLQKCMQKSIYVPPLDIALHQLYVQTRPLHLFPSVGGVALLCMMQPDVLLWSLYWQEGLVELKQNSSFQSEQTWGVVGESWIDVCSKMNKFDIILPCTCLTTIIKLVSAHCNHLLHLDLHKIAAVIIVLSLCRFNTL